MIEKIDINANAIWLRKKLNEDANSPIDIFSLVSSIDNITIVFYPMSKRISGMCVKVDENNIIAINSESTYGRQRYTLAHELCHLYFHKNLNNSICPKDSDRSKDEKEIEADIFASYFLAPYESLKSYITNTLGKNKGELNVEDVVNIEQYYGLSRQATLNRLVSEGYITRIKADTMRSGIIRSALKQGYDEKLYLPSEGSKKYYTIGKYIKIAEELNNKEKVSSGKYEELLLDAYRSDIVYGSDDEVEIYD